MAKALHSQATRVPRGVGSEGRVAPPFPNRGQSVRRLPAELPTDLGHGHGHGLERDEPVRTVFEALVQPAACGDAGVCCASAGP
ncbi:hypothetical protein SHTP_1537 [Mycobacterium ulcerans subsp. shinshuense]|uniref:Uncharacterized protein n=1 Tax=Mycobacterium ulcerans subsp. shinshuense TaxID=1124626 RepID=A0A1B4Y170_MYCUL|nr:hypothetical protein SHTP_1537 [Mycobacterium ulcerans subsp. shinshuense]